MTKSRERERSSLSLDFITNNVKTSVVKSVRTKLDSYKLLPKWYRYVMSYLNLFLGSILVKADIRGRQYIPKKGPYIIAINHFHIFDPALVAYSIRKPISFLAASDQEIEWYVILAGKLYGFIPTNRSHLAPSTIKKAIQVLAEGDILGIFPEATADFALREPKKGVTYLSVKSACKILPVGIVGLDDIWNNWLRGVRPKVSVRIGKPFSVPEEFPPDRNKREKLLSDIGNAIMCHIAALLPEDRHGYYSGNQKIKYYKG